MIENIQSRFKDYRHWIKTALLITVIFTCLFASLNYSGFLNRDLHVARQHLVYLPRSNNTKQSGNLRDDVNRHTPQNIVLTRDNVPRVPVIPVLDTDHNVILPRYNGVPLEVYNTSWWISAAYLQWDLEKRPRDYECKHVQAAGNWWVCQDGQFNVKAPCLVYSFGIANDFSFDDAMAAQGCDVHSFDPSMNIGDHVRENNVHFHAIGLSGHNEGRFNPRKDMYVTDDRTWTVMTLQLIKAALGHKNRDIDVLKIDVEGHEWSVIENLIDDGMFPSVKQFMLEYHLFPDWPEKSEYPKLLQTYKKVHDLGFQKFVTAMHPLTHIPKDFNIQADVAYVNTKYIPQDTQANVAYVDTNNVQQDTGFT